MLVRIFSLLVIVAASAFGQGRATSAQSESGKVNPGAGNTSVGFTSKAATGYMKALNQVLGSRWLHYVSDLKHARMISAGMVTLKFVLNAKGRITRLQVISNTSNAAHAALCKRVFLESQADIVPPPRELLRNGVFEDTVKFHLY